MKRYSIPAIYENISNDFEVFAAGEKTLVYSCRVSAYPINQVWPGYQRPTEQTEKSSFVMVGSNDEFVLKIKTNFSFDNVTVRPVAKNIESIVSDDTVEVKLPGPGQYSIEFDGRHNVLTVFVNPEKEFETRQDSEVIYFAPGVHYLEDKLKLESNQTVFIDEGAIVYGGIFAQNKENISVIGYGVLDCSKMDRASLVESVSAEEMGESGNSGNSIFFANCKNIEIDGITIVDAAEWSVRFDGCENIVVDNIKLIGMWRYNADGCDFCNCSNGIIKNSYLRNFDDCIVVKGLKYNRDLPVENITAENCVIWCDWGKAMEIGAETCAPYMKNIHFKDCYVIHNTYSPMDICHGDRAEISDVTFENIFVEYIGDENAPVIQKEIGDVYDNFDEKFVPPLFVISAGVTMWSSDDHGGDMKNIRISNINIHTEKDLIPAIEIHKIEKNVKIENLQINSIKLNGKDFEPEIFEKILY